MPAQPLLQHHQDPDHLAVVAGVLLESARQQAVDELLADEAAGSHAAQRLGRQRVQGCVPDGPGAERQAEAVLLLGQDLVRQEAAQGLLEEPAQLQALELVARRQLQREVQQPRIQQRETHLDVGQPGRADHLGQVVLGQRVAPVEGQHLVHQAGVMRTCGPGGPLVLAGGAGVDRRQKGRCQHLGHAQPVQQVVALHAVRHRHTGLADIARPFLQQRNLAGHRIHEEGMQDPGPQRRRDLAVGVEHPLLGVARVAAEEFVATVTGQDARVAVGPCPAGAVEGRHRR
mmetsp:Transcript_39196/g.92152  ORF Transcript_39196/g.92152 Transcript_39196/m.92152 type:complete len:287 (+) Transcript_39196:1313-2173(+)